MAYEPFEIGGREFFTSFPAICDTCEAKRVEAAAVRERIAREEAREREIVRVIPPDLRRTDIHHDGFNRRAWNTLRRWHPANGKWLVMLGETGLSKSRICALIAMKLIRDGLRVEWVTANAFQWAASREFDDNKEERARARHWLATWKSAPVLVYDDFGKGTFPPAVERHLFDIVDHRKAFDLPMLISCNTHPEALLAAGALSRDRGAPLVGRMLEAAGEVIALSSPNPAITE